MSPVLLAPLIIAAATEKITRYRDASKMNKKSRMLSYFLVSEKLGMAIKEVPGKIIAHFRVAAVIAAVSYKRNKNMYPSTYLEHVVIGANCAENWRYPSLRVLNFSL